MSSGNCTPRSSSLGGGLPVYIKLRVWVLVLAWRTSLLRMNPPSCLESFCRIRGRRGNGIVRLSIVEGQRPGQLWDNMWMGAEKGGTTGWYCQNKIVTRHMQMGYPPWYPTASLCNTFPPCNLNTPTLPYSADPPCTSNDNPLVLPITKISRIVYSIQSCFSIELRIQQREHLCPYLTAGRTKQT